MRTLLAGLLKELRQLSENISFVRLIRFNDISFIYLFTYYIKLQ